MILSKLQIWLREVQALLDSQVQAATTIPDQSDSSLLETLFGFEQNQSFESRALLYTLRDTYGGEDSGAKFERNIESLIKQCNLFMQLYGDGDVSLLRAPARINILGEHVDYVSYLPTASLTFGSREHDMRMLYRASSNNLVRGASTFDAYSPFSFTLDDSLTTAIGDAAPRPAWLNYLQLHAEPAPHWSNYVKGAICFAQVMWRERVRRGFEFVVDASIPPRAGASSSSALVVLTGAAVRRVNAIAYELEELAQHSSQAEWYTGTRGGAMDHTTICLAKRESALHISYADQQTKFVPLPDDNFRWVTFYTHAADKNREVMLEYNERALVSRWLIPAIITNWSRARPDLYRAWNEQVEAAETNLLEASAKLKELLQQLPAELSLLEVQRAYPHVFEECRSSFPEFVRERLTRSLKIRDRALHHVGEASRVAAVRGLLKEPCRSASTDYRKHIELGMHALGEHIESSHESLRCLYEVSTPAVEELINVLAADPHVYGARLMGGGFGGNVLALVHQEHLSRLLKTVQSEFYARQGRDGSKEGAIMISTPGRGLTSLDVETVRQAAVENFNATWWEADRYRTAICRMLDGMTLTAGVTAAIDEVWPVIVAAGRGTRARATGLEVAKPLASVNGVPAITRVVQAVKAGVRIVRPPIIIVSPETEVDVRQALSGEDVIYVLQPAALGTGDAVLCAYPEMRAFRGLAFVVWSTQPVIQVATMTRTLKLARLFSDYRMIVPTAVVPRPYAPVRRDYQGQVCLAEETHLEGARQFPHGETNIGLFLLKSNRMFEELLALRQSYWNEAEGRYNRVRGELGFPNELINRLSQHQAGVLASPIADPREAQGIKSRSDVSLCEQFLDELKSSLNR